MSNVVKLPDPEADPQVYEGESDELFPTEVFQMDGAWWWRITHPRLASFYNGPFDTAQLANDNMMWRPGDADKDPDEAIARADAILFMGVPR
jgi:hypothetical protein